MTRVVLSPAVLEYRQAMADLIHDVCEKNRITGVDPRGRRKELFSPRMNLPALCRAGFLNPPYIDDLDPVLFLIDGRLDGMVHIGACGVFGVMNVYVILEDERGKQIESGFALEDYMSAGYWCYFPSASVRPDTPVTVRAIAMDPLGGVGIQSESVTV